VIDLGQLPESIQRLQEFPQITVLNHRIRMAQSCGEATQMWNSKRTLTV